MTIGAYVGYKDTNEILRIRSASGLLIKDDTRQEKTFYNIFYNL
jgi:hypothetical protein